MFRGTNLIKIVGVIVACAAIIVVLGTIARNKQAEEPETEQATESVIVTNKLDIPDITEVDEDTYSLEMNDGEALFTDDEIEYAKKTGYFVTTSNLDTLSRTQSAWMNACKENERSVDREMSLKDIEPTGWHVNGIYDKTHLLCWKLSNSDAEQNIIAATEYADKIEKAKYDREIIDYVEDNPDVHVLYRVTPYYVDEELLARGVLIEAYSVEDDGKFQMCEFVYNAQPGCEINYVTGAYNQIEPLNEALGISRDELEALENISSTDE